LRFSNFCYHGNKGGLEKIRMTPFDSDPQNPQFGAKQDSPAIADKPARRERMPTIAPIRRAYNVVADNTGLSSCV